MKQDGKSPADTQQAASVVNASRVEAGAVMAPAIQTRSLRKLYGSKLAVSDLTVTVNRGEVFGFLGPNGAGKSTVVKMLVGLVYPTSGEATLFGRPVGDRAMKRQLGFLPELFRFQEWLRAEELLDFHARLCGLARDVRKRRLRAVLELVGLDARAGDQLRTFSKGMLQRIGIAQALIHDPELIILDEPTSALDPIGRRDVRDLIRRLKSEGKTVFLNSHLLSEVEMVCDRVAIIDRGIVVQAGALQDLLGKRELELCVENLSPGLFARLSERWSVIRRNGSYVTLAVDGEGEAPDVAEMVLAGGGRLYSLTPTRRSLEDLFVETVQTREGAVK